MKSRRAAVFLLLISIALAMAFLVNSSPPFSTNSENTQIIESPDRDVYDSVDLREAPGRDMQVVALGWFFAALEFVLDPFTPDDYDGLLDKRETREELEQRLRVEYDPQEQGERSYEEDWQEFFKGLGLTEEDESNVRDMVVEHEAHNLGLIRRSRQGEISGEERWNQRRSMEHLRQRLSSVLSPEQLTAFWDEHQRQLETFRQEMDQREKELEDEGYGEETVVGAALSNDFDAVRNLIDAGADVNETTVDGGNSPLTWAAFHDNAQMARVLIEAGADVNWVDEIWQGTALHEAASYGHVDVIRVLVAAGANLEFSSNYRFATPLYSAAMHGHTDAVRELLALGADATGSAGVAALEHAIDFWDFEMEQMLIDAGADQDDFQILISRAMRESGRILRN